MRRDSFKLTLTRIALAYVIALQALLGSWAGSAVAAYSLSFDPSLVLCRATGGDAQSPVHGDGMNQHCAMMCLSGGCAAGGPPAAVSASVTFPLPLVVAVPSAGDQLLPVRLTGGLHARGPPSIG